MEFPLKRPLMTNEPSNEWNVSQQEHSNNKTTKFTFEMASFCLNKGFGVLSFRDT